MKVFTASTKTDQKIVERGRDTTLLVASSSLCIELGVRVGRGQRRRAAMRMRKILKLPRAINMETAGVLRVGRGRRLPFR